MVRDHNGAEAGLLEVSELRLSMVSLDESKTLLKTGAWVEEQELHQMLRHHIEFSNYFGLAVAPSAWPPIDAFRLSTLTDLLQFAVESSAEKLTVSQPDLFSVDLSYPLRRT